MKAIALVFLLGYYFFGILFLPMGNFSSIPDLPAMYQHCKETEDKEMTVFDFVTDHLVDIDFIFDQHDKDDEQRPHIPVQFNHLQIQTAFTPQNFCIQFLKPVVIKEAIEELPQSFISSEYIFKIFRPPII